MTYLSWYKTHGEKHKAIMAKLTDLSDDEVIAYFRFDNMVRQEPDFCLLYKENKKCHEMEALNCYLCACPNFKFDDDGLETFEEKTLYSTCGIDSKEGAQYIFDNAVHQDCSACLVPHHETYIKKVFDRDWFKIMKDVC